MRRLDQDKQAFFTCPNCGGQALESKGSTVSSHINTYRCSACGWSKLACGENCGSYLEYYAGKYTCVKCMWTGHGPSYEGDSDGCPTDKEKRPKLPPAKCNRCGITIQPGELVMRHSSNPLLMVCKRCAEAGGFSSGLEKYK